MLFQIFFFNSNIFFDYFYELKVNLRLLLAIQNGKINISSAKGYIHIKFVPNKMKKQNCETNSCNNIILVEFQSISEK